MISPQRLAKIAAVRATSTSPFAPRGANSTDGNTDTESPGAREVRPPVLAVESPEPEYWPVPLAVPGHSPASGTAHPSPPPVMALDDAALHTHNIIVTANSPSHAWGEAGAPSGSAVSTASPAHQARPYTSHGQGVEAENVRLLDVRVLHGLRSTIIHLEAENVRLLEVVSEIEKARDGMFATVALVHSMAAETKERLTAELEEQARAALVEQQRLRAEIAALKDENVRAFLFFPYPSLHRALAFLFFPCPSLHQSISIIDVNAAARQVSLLLIVHLSVPRHPPNPAVRHALAACPCMLMSACCGC